MEENGKKWKKSVVDVQIEGVLVQGSSRNMNTDPPRCYKYNI